MNIVISGASGFVGTALKNALVDHNITSLSSKDFQKNNGDFAKLFESSDIVINLAGAPIIGRWSDSYKQVLYTSRINTTKRIVDTISSLEIKPKLLISTSAVGIYSNSKVQSEDDYELSDDFLGKLCQDWEVEALKAECQNIRTAIFRFGIVLGKNGGALEKMLPAFKLGLGGTIGDGHQHFSWVHLEDLINAFTFAIENQDVTGVFNLTAPTPTTNAIFTATLAKALRKPAFLPVPEFALKLLYSEGAKVLTDGQCAIPKKLLELGFKFKFLTIEDAICNIINESSAK